MVGYDISEEMIEVAEKNKISKEMRFGQKNLEKDFDEVEQYDVVIVLFGLHWMNDLDSAAGRISKSLRDGGLLLTLTPI
jgi:2-polyprenyl-3-methyl-5-hydroxy-6-metoxy-1,4-benzoquinol methylase